jgi:hypothetical protein
MRVAKALTLVLLLVVGLACNTVSPTPVLVKSLDSLHIEVLDLYLDCSDGVNYLATLETCNVEALDTKTLGLMTLSVEFISADIRQPRGYDIYLRTAMVFFRISERNLDEYTEAERIARQFFEVQKATSGRDINLAIYHLVLRTAATASYQYWNVPDTLNTDRKSELLLVTGEGTILIGRIEGVRLIHLNRSLSILEFVITQIH